MRRLAVTHEKRITRAYLRDMGVSLAVYFVLLVAAIRFGRPMPDGLLRTLFLASPIVGFGLMLRAIVIKCARMDEYMRMRLLENVAIATAITAAVSFTYGFLETAGFPKLSMFTVWIVLAIAFGTVQCGRKLLGR
jgi:hypothetical protein